MIKLERIAVAGFNVDEAIHTKQSPRRNTRALLFLALGTAEGRNL
jgi:hypothetical protein